MPRTAQISRTTRETDIRLEINLDGTGQSDLATGVGFLDHMLELLAKTWWLRPKGKGRRAICKSINTTRSKTSASVSVWRCEKALGDKRDIRRYGSLTLPMDEALVTTAIDLGRALLVRVRGTDSD